MHLSGAKILTDANPALLFVCDRQHYWYTLIHRLIHWPWVFGAIILNERTIGEPVMFKHLVGLVRLFLGINTP